MRILAGVETEYGLSIEGRGPEEQIEDSMTLVRSDPNEGRSFWNYRYESPRADLRGFVASRLSVDPKDAEHDKGRKPPGPDSAVRADRVLPNGGRFYNDHGHPEYATPECWTLDALTAHDQAGEQHVVRAAQAYEAATGRRVRVYKNNSDFHGAAYGTHESYLMPRRFGFEELFAAVVPILVARTLLCGSGKVGSELAGSPCKFQLSARADFFSETAGVDTLFRRPVFNTRDEPHSLPGKWVRLHVITGDANCLPSCTRRRVGLVKLALSLLEADSVPRFRLEDPADAFQAVSRSPERPAPIVLDGGKLVGSDEVLEAYLAAAEHAVPSLEAQELIAECRALLACWGTAEFAAQVDWAAKLRLLESASAESGWDEWLMRAYDLEYSSLEPSEGLSYLLPGRVLDFGEADRWALEPTRARARGIAVRFPETETACWRSVTIRGREFELDPDREYDFPADLDVESFIQHMQENP